MIKPFIFGRPDVCPSCKKERSVEAYDHNDVPLKLSLAMDMNKDVRTWDISYLKCKNCGKEFFPNWERGFPYPMSDENFTHFMNGYIQSYEKS